ncbi:hypothetical protein GGX14DRAFT_326668, partial [Mycena pura]
YGPYNTLLTYCFDPGLDFVVSPEEPPKENNRDAVDFTVYIIVRDAKQRPVIFLEVKDDSTAAPR